MGSDGCVGLEAFETVGFETVGFETVASVTFNINLSLRKFKNDKLK
jgi:hypothetical protein